MSKLEQLKTLLSARGLWAKKSFGQNFLIDEGALEKIAAAGELLPSDHVIEVGPGTGFLTERLIEKAGRVTSVELDRDMVAILKEQFKFSENLAILNEDILDFKVPGEPYKVVANIPYSITSPLLKHFLQSGNRPSLMVLLIQKEVAEKICAVSGKSVITIETQLFGEPEILGLVRASSFYPAPKVDSAILKIRVFDQPKVPVGQLKDFLRMLKFGFSQKRKKLANSLGAGIHMKPAEVKKLLASAGIDPECRAEELEVEDWSRLAKIIDKSE
jgi:16S rRNA (adenine1518-N6/adenine1519-N6)-dimethyltransferase